MSIRMGKGYFLFSAKKRIVTHFHWKSDESLMYFTEFKGGIYVAYFQNKIEKKETTF